jgi:excisionase family DNA binding protein
MLSVLTLEEVADYLRVHPSTIYRLVKRHQIPAFKIGSDWRFNRESIDVWRVQAEGGPQATEIEADPAKVRRPERRKSHADIV